MKIAVLTHNLSTYHQQRLNQLGLQRGHAIRFIHLSYCYTNITASAPQVYYKNNELIKNLDVIIPRFGAQNSFYGSAVLRQFERSGVYTPNSASAIGDCLNKLQCLQKLADQQVPIPLTGFADSPEETEQLVALVKGAPLIVRLLENAKGRSTVFAETQQAAISVINAFKQLKANIIVQEYIKDSDGNDIKCIVLDNQVVSVLQREIKDLHFRSRHRFLSHAKPIKINDEEKNIVLKAAKSLDLNLATVDFIRSKRGPLILDIDPNPNIEAFEKITQQDIVTPLLDFIEKRMVERLPK